MGAGRTSSKQYCPSPASSSARITRREHVEGGNAQSVPRTPVGARRRRLARSASAAAAAAADATTLVVSSIFSAFPQGITRHRKTSSLQRIELLMPKDVRVDAQLLHSPPT